MAKSTSAFASPSADCKQFREIDQSEATDAENRECNTKRLVRIRVSRWSLVCSSLLLSGWLSNCALPSLDASLLDSRNALLDECNSPIDVDIIKVDGQAPPKRQTYSSFPYIYSSPIIVTPGRHVVTVMIPDQSSGSFTKRCTGVGCTRNFDVYAQAGKLYVFKYDFSLIKKHVGCPCENPQWS